MYVNLPIVDEFWWLLKVGGGYTVFLPGFHLKTGPQQYSSSLQDFTTTTTTTPSDLLVSTQHECLCDVDQGCL